MPRGRLVIPWTAYETATLMRHYGRIPASEIVRRYLTGRTVAAVVSRARQLQLGDRRRAEWTNREMDIVRKHYSTLRAIDIQDRYLPHRSIEAIKIRAHRLGLRQKNHRPWTDDENRAVVTHFASPGGMRHLVKTLERGAREIDGKARALSLTRQREDLWSKAEVAKLQRDYPRLGRKTVIAGRSTNAVATQARRLGLRLLTATGSVARRPWSDAEMAVLRRYRHVRARDLVALLPGRSVDAIHLRRSLQGLAYQGSTVSTRGTQRARRSNKR